jgi:hypothetical protein
MMGERKVLGRLYIVVTLAISFLILLVSCSEEDVSEPASFNPPQQYTGTYRVVFDWMTPDSSGAQCNITINFRADDSVLMWVDQASGTGDFDICSSKGTYSFRRDTLELNISDPNMGHDLCNPSASPDGIFKYTVDGDYLVFELRTPDPYRRIELVGRQ